MGPGGDDARKGPRSDPHGLQHHTKSCCALLQMWTSVSKGSMTATPMPCVRTQSPPTSAPASPATGGRAGSARVSGLGGQWWVGQQGKLLISSALVVTTHADKSAAPSPKSQAPLSEVKLLPRADYTVLSEMSFV